MTLGEMRQLAAVEALRFSEDDYEALIRAKTRRSSRPPARSARLRARRAPRRARAYGQPLGHGVSGADDLLDYTAEEAVTGKPSGLDLREHKVTLPLIAALRDGARRKPARDRSAVRESGPG